MGKEFNLSEKIVSERPDKELVEVLFKNDVKEFIKRLKENINDYWTNSVGQCICPESMYLSRVLGT